MGSVDGSRTRTRGLVPRDTTPLDTFEQNCADVLERTPREIKAQIILCEPYFVPVLPEHAAMRADLEPIIEVVRRPASRFDGILVPMDRVLMEMCTRAPMSTWVLQDGVHPTLAGHALMAQTWLRAVRAI